MHFFILGVLVAQFTYVTVQWVQLRYKEYLYYGSYIATFIIYVLVLFRDDIFGLNENSNASILLDSFKRPIAFILYYEYFEFAQYFIGIKVRFPKVYNRIQPLKRLILGFALIQVVIQLAGLQYEPIGNYLYYLFSIFLFGMFITFFIKLWNSQDRLIRYVLWASLSISVGAFVTNLLLILNSVGLVSDYIIINYYFIPSFAGVLLEVYFFNTGIAFKISMSEKRLIARQQELIRQLSENEKLLIAQQKIRNKLAQDLHDDIGATLSGIALHSHMVRQQILTNKTDSVMMSLNLIETGAVEMVNNLNDVVWTVNPKNDSVEEMLERLKEYIFIMTQAKAISVKWKVDEEELKNIRLTMDYRRNIYLICKEAINNAVKYSGCSHIVLLGSFKNNEVLFSIGDDGKGFEMNDICRGNGLRNMRDRAKESNMELNIDSAEGSGTLVSLHYRITQ